MPKDIFYQVSNAVVKQLQDFSPLFDATRVDSYLKLLNVVYFVLRFCSRLPVSKLLTITPPDSDIFKISKSDPFTAKDHELEEIMLLLQAQKQNPPEEKHYRTLQLDVDKYGIIRCKGGPGNFGLAHDTIYSVFLPRRCEIKVLSPL
jgi:hypothetical protein